MLLDSHGLFLVADGMGGHRAGDVASRMATETVRAFFESTAREDATWPFHYDPTLTAEENRLVTGIKVANKSIYEASARNHEHRGMGTTVVGLLFAPAAPRFYVGHVGDSRCYRVRSGEIRQLTQDHSLVNEYLRAMPDLTDEQRDELPRNVITRALGMTEGVQVDLVADEPLAGDCYVLCSDGLSGMISDTEIQHIVSTSPDPAHACERLIRLANEHGGEDNVTAIVLRVIDDSGINAALTVPAPAEPSLLPASAAAGTASTPAPVPAESTPATEGPVDARPESPSATEGPVDAKAE